MSSTRRRGRPPHDDLLTPAEWRVVHAIQHGMSNRDIATRRGISVDAVKYHVANVMAKLGVGNRKALRRWFRAPRHSALAEQAVESVGMNNASNVQLGPIAQISRSVSDMAAAEHWYGKVLGLPHLYTFGKFAFFDCGGTRLFLSAEQPAGPESILYLRVPDIRVAYEELRGRGVEFLGAPHLVHRHPDGTEEWLAHFKDSEGRLLAVMSQVQP
ncbi:MAG TPA: LuxR C-terminal-related transcriptional regulator [Steroidobacteraceae bacterium]|jgi:DNA-binding CsgD family transcriptional regulator/catechol 2,3-dioxygenase-like lactoylglutathione lyase family enzyme|nr:LuxR C-terminal-related transcriptional regulator [Steroidobacteraceae bacterium]